MAAAIETPLGKALRAHRDTHQGCQGCPEYLAIVNRATAQRVMWEGPRMAHANLSILEAAEV